jgi:hypothetical protein
MTDNLDGCSVDCNDPDRVCPDDATAAVALFADVEFTDPAAVSSRVVEWRELFT